MKTTDLYNFCRKAHIEPSDLTGKSRKQPLPLYRAVFAYLMYPDYSQTDIGKLFNRKPSTINNSMRRFKESLQVGDKNVLKALDNINISLNNLPMDRPDFNLFSKIIYKDNKKRGFHDNLFSDKHYLCLITSELMEAVNADRIGRRADLAKFNYQMDIRPESERNNAFPKYFRVYIKDTVEDELADAVIRLLDFAGAKNYNLGNMAFTPDNHNNIMFTESIWDIIYELVACEEEEAIFCAIKKIEGLCNRMFIDLWKHTGLKVKYNKTRPYKHNKLY